MLPSLCSLAESYAQIKLIKWEGRWRSGGAEGQGQVDYRGVADGHSQRFREES